MDVIDRSLAQSLIRIRISVPDIPCAINDRTEAKEEQLNGALISGGGVFMDGRLSPQL
jgi:hypothetical protein